VVFFGDRERPLDTGNSFRHLVASNHAALGKLGVIGLACSLEYRQGMLGKHQHFGRRLGMKDDQHGVISNDGHAPTLTEAPSAAKTENQGHDIPTSRGAGACTRGPRSWNGDPSCSSRSV